MIKNISLKSTTTWAYILSFVFIFLNLFLIIKDFYYLSFLPLVLFIVLVAIYRLDTLIYIIVFLTPLSIPLLEILETSDVDMYLPTEPLLFGVMILFIFKLLYERSFDKRILMHPVAIAIYFNLGWILVTCVTSTDPLVSIKFLVARLWFVISFFFIATQLFRKRQNIYVYLFAYIIPMVAVIIFTIKKHTVYGLFDMKASHYVVAPFFKDHTSYGAITAMIIPVLIGIAFLFRKKDIVKQIPVWIFILVFFVAVVLSYARAAWLSLIIAFGVAIILLLKIKFRTIFWFIILTGAFLYSFRLEILQNLEKNSQDSSSNLAEHVESISNISTDASNMERINRWSCALRMFAEKPVFGFGPGTYMFEYAPYQLSYQRTIISTNFGDLGNAHSEYIGPMAESGILGSLTFILIVLFVIITGVRVYKKTRDREIKILSLVVLLGLITYYVHGFLNNFLDTDKASALFWGYSAILVALDVYHLKKPEDEKTEKQED
ncbi:MAG: O-antigen ligase family protein [Bacteroidales bacterium]|nr:O-antigen ligase family protein [Bacteroidales bacterium]